MLCGLYEIKYSKTCVSKRPKVGYYEQVSLNAGQKYCRMLKWKISAILSIFIKLPIVILCFVYFEVAVLYRFYCKPICNIHIDILLAEKAIIQLMHSFEVCLPEKNSELSTFSQFNHLSMT